ncbi:hypothetical protein PCANC_28190 [Puccinia coronata f. sp. avenae]|uniref:Uncharacterized protein n=1 Tax=Puccinia coronata f. sp. avenae TaxID=200324 RepID=A0A2N5TAX8_9BASI|nr:hypothetical protein PCANC_28190 [Puccinia coronata f. sp. avenae]
MVALKVFSVYPLLSHCYRCGPPTQRPIGDSFHQRHSRPTALLSFSSEARSTFTAINNCEACFHHDSVSSMTQYAQQCYSELNSLVDTCYRVYPEQARTIVTPLGQFDSQCRQNLALFRQGGIPVQSIIPSNFAQTASRAGWSQTSSFASSSSSRSSSSSSSGGW